jgi:glycosyltransferase involved in cell wall biosynthesis
MSKENKLKLVYIIGTFPSLTTTFIDREVRNLRAWGVDLQVLSIRRPAPDMPLSDEQRQLEQIVTYLLPVKWWSFVVGNLRFLLLRPLVYLGTLLYLVSRAHPDLKSRVMTILHFAEGVYAAHLLRSRTDPPGGQSTSEAPFDQLHAHFADRAAIVALVISRLLDVPYSLTAHANDIYVNPVLLQTKIAEAKFTTTCTGYNYDHLLQVAETLAEASGGQRTSDTQATAERTEPATDLRQERSVESDIRELKQRIHLVYHGLELARYQPEQHPADRERPLMLAVGRLTEKKGFAYLISACKELVERGYDFECHIVGEGPLRPELEAQIAHLDLEDTLTLCGALSHKAVIDKYRQTSLFVLPCIVARDGDRDGIPNVLIEAMAMQIPVVSTDHSSIPELVQTSVTGLLVPPKDEQALAEAMARLLDNRSLCREMGQRGRQKVLEDFDVDRNVKRLYDLFVNGSATQR